MKRIFSGQKRPIIIAGPCMAESKELLFRVVEPLAALSRELEFEFVFKASFDKANRTSGGSYRGPGLEQAMDWFGEVKEKFGVSILTDVHETGQCVPVAKVCDVLQIPAFLCRQTDLLVAAVETGRAVNIKKGQFAAPSAARNFVDKVTEAASAKGLQPDVAVTERGASFGYGDLIVDPRSFPIMKRSGATVIFDVTHSLQQPAASGAKDAVSGGLREFAPAVARAAVATGYVDGLFLEVHPDPSKAKSDAATQLSQSQAEALLRQLVPLLRTAKTWPTIDRAFV